MKQSLFCIIVSFLMVACSSNSEDSPLKPFNPEELVPIQLGLEEIDSLSAEQNTDFSRGWEEMDVTDVYLIPDYKSANPGKSLKFTIGKYQKRIDAWFYMNSDQSKLYMSNGSESVLVAENKGGKDPIQCVLSSTPEIVASLDLSPTIKTPNDHPAYEPFGDKLFRSSQFHFTYKMDGNMMTYSIHYKGEKYTKDANKTDFLYHPKSGRPQSLELELTRFTYCIRAGVIIYMDSPRKVKDQFEEKMEATKMENWSVVAFLNNSPQKFGDKYEDYLEPSVVTLYQQPYPFEDDLLYWVEGSKGVGCLWNELSPNGYSYVFASDPKKTDLCFSFYLNRNFTLFLEGNTIIIPMLGTKKNEGLDIKVEPNGYYDIRVGIHLDDFYNEMLRKKERSRAPLMDDTFGHVMDIPYEVIVTPMGHPEKQRVVKYNPAIRN